MNAPKISIIVPVYNAGEFLAFSLGSLTGQSEGSLEIIVVDDGSSDDSVATLNELAEADDRIKVMTQANKGPSEARTLGLSVATGKWIAFFDADDWLAPNAMKTWLDRAESNDLDLLIGNGFGFAKEEAVGANREPILRNQPCECIISGEDWIKHCTSVDEWPHFVWLQFFRRDLIETHQLGFRPDLLHEDILWTLQIALVANKVGFCSIPFYGYRRNPASITRQPSEALFVKRAESYLVVLSALICEANSNSSLRMHLLKHTNREAGHFFGLVRKNISTSSTQARLAKTFLTRNIAFSMFKGATTGNEFWRAIRYWLIFAKIYVVGSVQRPIQSKPAA